MSLNESKHIVENWIHKTSRNQKLAYTYLDQMHNCQIKDHGN